jgi:hypothetical protein
VFTHVPKDHGGPEMAPPLTGGIIRPRWFYPVVAVCLAVCTGAVVWGMWLHAQNGRYRITFQGRALIRTDTHTGIVCMTGTQPRAVCIDPATGQRTYGRPPLSSFDRRTPPASNGNPFRRSPPASNGNDVRPPAMDTAPSPPLSSFQKALQERRRTPPPRDAFDSAYEKLYGKQRRQ